MIFSHHDGAELKAGCRSHEIELIEPFAASTNYEMEEEPLSPEFAGMTPENEIAPTNE